MRTCFTGIRNRLVILCLLVFAVDMLRGSDWPMYRADEARSGYTDKHLPARLQVRWIKHADSPPQPAWSGRDTRMPFDLAFQPVVSQGLVVYGSSSDGIVRALSARTGQTQWRPTLLPP